MEDSQPSSHWSTKLGLLTGPVFILLGLLALKFSEKDSTLAYIIIFFGLFRLGMSSYMFFSKKGKPE